MDIEKLKDELIELKDLLNKTLEEKQKLEEENDLLAFENEYLRSQLAEYKCKPHPPRPPIDTEVEQMPSRIEELDVFQEGDDSFVHQKLHHIANAGGGKNMIATSFFVSPNPEEMGDMVVCGGVDGVLAGYDVIAGVQCFQHRSTAPILCIDCAPPYVAFGTMDGSMTVLHFEDLTDPFPLVQSFKDHSKYVVAVAWSHSATFLATASYDKFVHIYRKK